MNIEVGIRRRKQKHFRQNKLDISIAEFVDLQAKKRPVPHTCSRDRIFPTCRPFCRPEQSQLPVQMPPDSCSSTMSHRTSLMGMAKLMRAQKSGDKITMVHSPPFGLLPAACNRAEKHGVHCKSIRLPDTHALLVQCSLHHQRYTCSLLSLPCFLVYRWSPFLR